MSSMNPPDSELMAYLVRMVTPMKREFSVSLNVSQFLSEEAYAKEIIGQALLSKDERLRHCAEYAQTKLLGPRSTSGMHRTAVSADSDRAAGASGSASGSARSGTGSAAAYAEEASADDMRAKMMAKYRSGLR